MGINVSYRREGNGDEFFFLFHGWGAPLSLYERTISELSVKYTVIAPEFPGFGETPEPTSPWGMEEYTRFAIEFIRSFGAERVVLYGHSFGGRVIIKMTEMGELPFEIEKIILVDSAGIKPKKSLAVKAKIAVYKTGKWALGLPPVKALFPRALEKFQSRSGSSDYRAASPAMRQCFTRVVNEDLTHLLSRISAPTLLIWGDKDDSTPLSDGKLMESLIPDAGLVVLEGAGHYSFLEQPYIYLAVLRSFLSIGE
ncbi:MAG: alpha/beta hydrolase [Clostridia bacterium]|nr:alpha/beta hydrolase [Clostridia bacterium]